ncbi:dUTP diphosphatase [Spiroplasma culicicola]|uniref:dUTP diphosphatase n=1 Tax=Spiroplasma culicicola AES-1 TaxID=1276246 RepID=W6A831_9MOLU|nr:dUTP diphosphatase [Spiroplasma culicicola]AHI53141.1 dUTP diphosphatase [Spiroplasma culicicola AES-1]
MLQTKHLIYLSQKQEQLDNYIRKAKNFTDTTDIIQKKMVAFLVELGEFINEERSFKYWSNKASSEKSILLEEYIDGLHFIVSLGNNIEFEFDQFTFKAKEKGDIIQIYLDTYRDASIFNEDKVKQKYSDVLNSFLNMGYNLGFQEDELIAAYNKKNEKNFERQDNNY